MLSTFKAFKATHQTEPEVDAKRTDELVTRRVSEGHRVEHEHRHQSLTDVSGSHQDQPQTERELSEQQV